MNNAIFGDALNADWLLNYILICLNCFKPQIPTIFILMLDYEYTYDTYPTENYFTPIFPNVGRGDSISTKFTKFCFKGIFEKYITFYVSPSLLVVKCLFDLVYFEKLDSTFSL